MYIDSFVMAVPTARKDEYVAHCSKGDSIFIEFGATRVVECWGDDVPEGKTTDFRMAVKAKEDETVAVGWIEWPDKETRDAGMAKMMADDFDDERLNPETNPMPFDGKRMIYGGFSPVSEMSGN